MKTSYFFLFIVLSCLIGCGKTDEPAPTTLYKRWKAVNTDAYITFLREGIVLYGKDSTADGCCSSPRFFQSKDNKLIFKDIAPKSLPVQLQTEKPECANIRCRPPEYTDWEIIFITPNHLVLDAENRGRQTYVAAP
ncbi:hypothetical protein [Fibrella aquatilis]|uniref:Uncharacterized protein n=1 Tax=Fibrella aquatilis TaxID=2817059 RepID=A0A939K0H3_9BACT|nr:hypothetical protein [Fibrella aquatilis]MBO0934194.1 hypothetical protein [Fibrella aquatilis]